MKSILAFVLLLTCQLALAQTNYLPMSPYWRLSDDRPLSAAGVTYNGSTKTLSFPASANTIFLKDSTGNSVALPASMVGKRVIFKVKATGGATMKLVLRKSDYSVAIQTPSLGDGQSYTFVVPADRYGVPEAASSKVASTVTATLTEVVGPELVYASSVSGKVGTALSVAPSKISTGITSCLASPALPAGLTLNNTTCVISGTPSTVSASTAYTISAKDVNGEVKASLSISIAANSPTVSYAPNSLTVKVGDSVVMNPTLNNMGAAITSCTTSPTLPSGVVINNTNCNISGKPTVSSGSTSYVVTAKNSAGSGTVTISMKVDPAAVLPTLPAGPVGTNYMPMSPYWKLTDDRALSAVGASISKSVVYFPVTSNTIFAKDSTGNSVANLPATGTRMVFTVRAVGGAKMRLVFRKGDYSVALQSPFLGNGESYSFALPADKYAVPEASSGTTSVSGVRGYITLDTSTPVACVGSYGACSKTCGGGTQTFTITTPALNGGAACAAANGSVRACNTAACPVAVNCVGSFGSCSVSCGGGTQTYSITTPAANGGVACAYASGATQSCNTAPCSTAKYGTFENPYSRDSAWNVRPVNPKFGTDTLRDFTYKSAISSGAWSTGFFKANLTDKPVTVYPKGSNKGVWDPAAEKNLPSVTIPRWPTDVVPAAKDDGHADLYDPQTGLVHSFWQLIYNPTKLRWEAAQWSTAPINGTGWGTPAKYMSGARAAGVPTSGGILRKHEIEDGKDVYEHALAMSMPYLFLSGAAPGYVYPATSSDSDYAKNVGKFPEGALMMIPPGFDYTKLKKPFMKKIIKTLQTYGARVVDRNEGTPFVIYVENGAKWPGHTNPNTGAYQWDNDYAADIQLVQGALRMVTGQDSWIDKDNKPVDMRPDGTGLNLLAMRGPWDYKWGDSTVPPSYNSATEFLEWGATGSSRNSVAQTQGTVINRVTWAKLILGAKYRFIVEAKNGALVNATFRGASWSSEFSTGWQGHGYTVDFTPKTSSYLTLEAQSGVNVPSSAVKLILIKLP